MCAFFFENPVINPSGKLQFICSLFKVLNPTCATRRRGLSAGFFGSRNWRHPLERPSKWRWNVPRSVENDWRWKSAKHALFPIWRLGSLVKVVVCGHLEGWISWEWNVGIRFDFLNDMPNDVLGICLASPMSPSLKLWKKFKKFHWSPFPSVAAKSSGIYLGWTFFTLSRLQPIFFFLDRLCCETLKIEECER